MRTLFFSSSKPSSPDNSSSSSLIPRDTLSASIMEQKIKNAEPIITKWDLEASTYSEVASLFGEDGAQAEEFIRAVKELRTAMLSIVSDNLNSEKLLRAHELMEIAMKRLQKEFHQILSRNQNYLDREWVSSQYSTSQYSTTSDDDASEDGLQVASSSISEVERVSEIEMSDLKTIADCMISSGYGKECVKIYNTIRKSIVDECLYSLGVERINFSKIRKMDWEMMELKIENWLEAVKISVKTLFHGERILCDYVFSASERTRESCFAELSKEAAITLFSFPEQVARYKKSPEKIFRTLDLYEAIADLWPEIEWIFSFESTSVVRSQAVTSLVKLGENVRALLSDFETAMQKDSSKWLIPGGGVHPMTRYVMNYVVFLADYSEVLADIVADWQLSEQSSLPESYLSSPISDNSLTGAMSVKLAWIILLLLCKLDAKAKFYRDVSLSYLFLANNLNYVLSKVRSSNLKLLLGKEWLVNQETKVKQYAANYQRVGWSKVISSLPDNPTADIPFEAVEESFGRFNSAFEEAYRKQTSWIVPDPKLRDELKVSVAEKLLPSYRAFYSQYREMLRRMAGVDSFVRYAPDDIGNYVSDLFGGTRISGSTSSSSTSTSTSPSSHSRERW